MQAQSQPLTWLTSIARNRAIDSLRRNQTRPQIQGSGAFDRAADGEDDSVYDTVADSAPGPLDLLSQASDARELASCMEHLSAQQRQTLALAFYQGLSPRRGRGTDAPAARLGQVVGSSCACCR
jgi:RNA polymerase sigma-70 factor (ECF subfamily)